MIFVQMFYDRFTGPDVPVISFSNWLIATLPSRSSFSRSHTVSLVLLILTWAVLCMLHCPSSKQLLIDQKFCREQYEKLGPMSYEEIVVAIGFVVLSILWLFRVDLKFGDFTIPGRSRRGFSRRLEQPAAVGSDDQRWYCWHVCCDHPLLCPVEEDAAWRTHGEQGRGWEREGSFT